MIIAIRTDKPEAEVGVYSAKGRQLSYYMWQAHRELSNTLLLTLRAQLAVQQADFNDLTGVAIYRGPGSFTGLRIGITVANTLAYGLHIPVVGDGGEQWLEQTVTKLIAGKDDKLVQPEYGAEANISRPRK